MSASKLIAALALIGAAVLLTTSPALGEDEATSEKGVPETEIGLAAGTVFDTLTPDAVEENTTEPGEMDLIGRPHPEFPTIIPHGIAEFLPITSGDNMCMDCHDVEEKEEGEATPIPASHRTDLRNSPDELGEGVVGARLVCTSCHVAQTWVEPLVGNSFELR